MPALLVAYKQRCEARPAFAKALADQMAAFARRDGQPALDDPSRMGGL